MLSILTWNTQGDPRNDPEKDAILQSLCLTYDVVLLQECGRLAEQRIYAGKQIHGQAQAGALNPRCSTAVVANGCVGAGVWTGSSSGRSAVWVKIRDVVIASIHCESGGIGMTDLRRCMRQMATIGPKIIIGGDFNCSFAPDEELVNAGTTGRPVEFSLHTQPRPTHSGGGILDHFVSVGMQNVGVRRQRLPRSDHDAVSATFR
ncbi:endonuclease/exonuclease/phosphatase family protein [Caldimonas brevitalea]|uniref:Endonuclease/exonuclease/phosphatase domain-containing protein n=1 Tax=Caldimonas brevitalea TaxID=413882 RepID=A0A0G3BGI1_9BURK|nr:endonuclease/exonuclease/phosphatase family protein [Caldimonas brevitalea]AKJ28539.1 hypothetical protein AAW51_1848 [Caldimonas brevitalea]